MHDWTANNNSSKRNGFRSGTKTAATQKPLVKTFNPYCHTTFSTNVKPEMPNERQKSTSGSMRSVGYLGRLYMLTITLSSGESNDSAQTLSQSKA